MRNSEKVGIKNEQENRIDGRRHSRACDPEFGIAAISEAGRLSCHKAYNGLEALKALEENEIHLIILDIMMPARTG